MHEQFSRTALLLGEQGLEKLFAARVAVFGVGGVGGCVCEALARAGIGHFELIDDDTVSVSNINRQIIATHKTVGRRKTEVMRERILEINPAAEVTVRNCFILPQNSGSFDFSSYDYVVDAIDTVAAKLELAVRCREAGTPIISSMGAGNKLDPTAFRVADISKTKIDRLARVMRRELGRRGIKHLKVVYSEEEALTPEGPDEASASAPAEFDPADEPSAASHDARRRALPGSVSFVPTVVGFIIAGEVIKDLSGVNTKSE